MNILGHELPDDGCGDGNCHVRRPSGVRTNGGCQCLRSLPGSHVRLAVLHELVRLGYPRKDAVSEKRQ
jgi:hypothetical protein